MIHNRREILAGAVGVVLLTQSQATDARRESQQPSSGAGGFDFLHGRWMVSHKKLKARLVGSTEWITFPGTMDVQPILNGAGSIDENVIHDPDGTYLASSIRVFRPSTQSWSIHWADSRYPGLDKPLVGRFEGSMGRFYADDELDGRAIKVRFTYERLARSRARWAQAFSADGGGSWETNWIMAFEREGGT